MATTDLYQAVSDSLPDNSPRRTAWLSMIRCFSSIERVLMRHFAQRYQSSLPRYDVLTSLALNPDGLTMGDLATMLMVTKGNITGVVRRLEHEKLILRKTSKLDRRVQSVKISAKGTRLWRKMHADYDEIISALLAGESDAHLRSLERSLERSRRTIQSNAQQFEEQN